MVIKMPLRITEAEEVEKQIDNFCIRAYEVGETLLKELKKSIKKGDIARAREIINVLKNLENILNDCRGRVER